MSENELRYHSDNKERLELSLALYPRNITLQRYALKSLVYRMATERSDIAQEPSPSSAQNAESHGGRLVPKQRIEVTGSCLSINPNSSMPWQFLIFFLVLRAVNVPNIKKYPFLKRNLFVTVSNDSNPGTTVAKTAEVRVEGQMAKWNQSLDLL